MVICRNAEIRNFTKIPNHPLRDKNLSNKARGLLCTMLSLPEDWDYTVRGLAYICKDGVDGLNAQLRELEQQGYLLRKRIRDQNGRIKDIDYLIYEEPQTVKPYTVLPDTEMLDTVEPDMAEPFLESPAEINIDISNKEKQNTELRNIYPISSDEPLPYGQNKDDTMRKEEIVRTMDLYRETIRENINYDYLLLERPYEQDRLDEIVELIVECMCSTKQTIRVAGADYPAEAVRSRLMKLNMEHIIYVFSCLEENTTKIRNIKQYLLTALYNAPTTIGNYYSAAVRHDLYGESSYDL